MHLAAYNNVEQYGNSSLHFLAGFPSYFPYFRSSVSSFCHFLSNSAQLVENFSKRKKMSCIKSGQDNSSWFKGTVRIEFVCICSFNTQYVLLGIKRCDIIL